jgi:hypothetical protein
MMVRFRHAIRFDPSQLGSFTVMETADQARLANSLYDLFITSKGSPDIRQLQRLLHSLSDALLRPKDISEHPVSCPTDQMLFIASLAKNGRYRSAAHVYRLCSRLEHCFRCILLHVARLHNAGSGEHFPYTTEIGHGDETNDVEDEVQDEIEPQEPDVRNLTCGKEEMEGEPIGGTLRKLLGQPVPFRLLIVELQSHLRL